MNAFILGAIAAIWAGVLLFAIALCVTAGRADEAIEREREREQEQESRDTLYPPFGGWRA